MDERVRTESILPGADRRHSFLLALGDALRTLADPLEIQSVAIRILGEHLDANRVAYFTIQGADYVIERDFTREAMSLVGRYPVASFGGRALDGYRSGRILVSNDVAGDVTLTPAERAAYATVHVGAHIAVPLVKDGQFVVGLGVHSRRARVWTAEEILLVEETAERVWAAVVRARAEAALVRSEEKYRALFTNIDEAFCVGELLYDTQGRPCDRRLLEANPRYHDLVGTQFAIGKTAREVAPEVEDAWFQRYHEVVTTGNPLRFEHYLGPVRRWFDVFLSRVGGEGSHVYAAVFHETTERKRREAGLSFLADVSRDLVALTSIDETMQVLGARIGEHLGVSGCAFVEIDDAADLARIEYEWHQQGMRSVAGDYRITDFLAGDVRSALRAGREAATPDVHADLRMNGSSFAAVGIAAFVCVPIVSGGQWRFVLVIHHSAPREWRRDEIDLMQELTGRVWARLERAHAEEALREADRRKDEFLATLAHELRNPLAPIRNGLHYLRRTRATDADVAHVHQMMERQLGNLVRLVDDLLEVSRITRGKVELRRERVELAGIIQGAIETSRPLIEAGRHQLELSLAQAPLLLDADAVRLTQVFANLLNNAAKYTDAGGCIRLAAVREGLMARITVRDNGTGIPTAMLGRIFDLFTQGDDTHRRAQGGLGIGLTLVRSIVDMHGGTIEAHSDGPGHGSEFVVRLPLVETSEGEAG